MLKYNDTLVLVHASLSLAAISLGLVVAVGIWLARRLPRWTAASLVAMLGASVTRLMFLSEGMRTSHWISLALLLTASATALSFFLHQLRGAARVIYVSGAYLSLYLNISLAAVQLIGKGWATRVLRLPPSLSTLMVVEVALLILFVALGAGAIRRYQPPKSKRRSSTNNRVTVPRE